MSTGTNTENQNMAVSVESLILNGTAVTATVAAGASACFRVRRTAASTFTIFKVG